MKLSIVTPTYYRSDGSTLSHLKKALDSLFNQTHQDFKIYLIGDGYEHPNEIETLISNYDQSKILFVNLDVAKNEIFIPISGLYGLMVELTQQIMVLICLCLKVTIIFVV